MTAYSALVTDYLGVGTLAARPTPTLAPGGLGIYFATDVPSMYFWDGTIWTAGGAGSVTQVVAGGMLTGGTITTTGTISLAAVTAGLVSSNGTTIEATTVLPGLLWSSGTLSNTGVISIGATSGTIALGTGLSFSGQTLSSSGLGGTVTSVVAGAGLAGGTITTSGTISLGAIAGGDFLANTGTVSAVPTATVMGTITAGAGLSGGPFTAASGGTLTNAGVLVFGATTGTIAVGTNLSMSGQTLNASGVTAVVAGTGLNVGAGPGGTITTAGTLNVAAATTVALGGVIVGTNISVSGGTISVATGAGGVTSVSTGTGLTGGPVTTTGTISLSNATTAALGGVLVPASGGLTINAGTLSVGPPARVLVNSGTVAATGSSTISTDCSLGNVFTNTMTASATLASPTNVLAGATYNWIINAGTTGTLTLAYGSSFVFNSPYSNASPPAIGAGVNVLTAIASGTATLHSVLQAGTWA